MKLDWNDGALAKGLHCFEHQEFFAAHEFWESVWLNCEEPQKTFLQALIQLAAALHHQQRKNLPGALSLLKHSLQKLEAFPASFEQIDVAELRSAVSNRIQALEAETSKTFPPYPRIKMSASGSAQQNTD